jgi:hypothetical protein
MIADSDFEHEGREERRASWRPAQSFQTFTEENEGNKALSGFSVIKGQSRGCLETWHKPTPGASFPWLPSVKLISANKCSSVVKSAFVVAPYDLVAKKFPQRKWSRERERT